MGQMRRRTAVKAKRKTAHEVLMRTLAGCDKPAEALEIYYWSKEPGFLEIIRAIAMMPEETRSAIEAFSALAHDQATVTAHLDSRGVLTASVQAAKTVALAQYAAANDTDDVPHLLN